MQSNLTENQVALMEQSISAIAQNNTYAEILLTAISKKGTWQEKAVILSGSFANMFEICTVLNAAAQSTAIPLEIKKAETRKRHKAKNGRTN